MSFLGKVILFVGALFVVERVTNKRARVVRIAKSQIGPQDPDRYWRDVQPKLVGERRAWCGGFALWVLRQAGLTSWEWIPEAGFLGKLPRTQSPQPGDIAYFDDLQHHAIVDHVEGRKLFTVDGNQSPGESVAPRERDIGAAHSFYSIQPLLDGSIAA